MPPSNSPKRSPLSANHKLGEWQDGSFKFHSPEAEQRWAVEAYRSGVHAQDWQHGTPVDDKTRDLVLNDLGGPTAPMFRGPDGQYRFANTRTLEPPEIRDHRRRAFQGVKAADLTGPEMPGEDVIATRYAKATQPHLPAANDNARILSQKAPVEAEAEKPVVQAKPGIGRFAYMAAAQKEASHPSLEETLQHIDDGVRLLANGLTLGYADNIAAAGNAMFSPGAFGVNYDKNLADEKARSKAAQDRSGVVGAMIGAAPQFVPGAGDLIGLGGDIQMYLNDPSSRTLGNAGMTALGILPFVPSVASSIKRVDDALETTTKMESRAAAKGDDASEIAKADSEGAPSARSPEMVAPKFDPDDPVSVDAYFKRPLRGNEGPDGHVITKHVGKTREELLARYADEPELSGSSSFTDYETAEKAILAGLQSNKAAIVDWMRNPKRKTFFFDYDSGSPIGITMGWDGTEQLRTTARIGLRKDNAGNFYFFTAYPK